MTLYPTIEQRKFRAYQDTGCRFPVADPKPWYRTLVRGVGVRADVNMSRWLLGFNWSHMCRGQATLYVYLGPVISETWLDWRYNG